MSLCRKFIPASLCGNEIPTKWRGNLIPINQLLELYTFYNPAPRSLLLKFGQNRLCKCWDIPDMDKCRQDKCCLDKCRHGSWNLFNMVLGTYPLSLVKIEQVTAEILPALSFRWWWVVVVGGVPSHFFVKTKLRLRLGWVEVGLGFWQNAFS